MAGYSGTPLAKKLGIGPGCRVFTIDAPSGYGAMLDPLPPNVAFARSFTPSVDVVHLFATSAVTVGTHLTKLRDTMKRDGAVWVSWPKKRRRCRPTSPKT